MSTLRDLRGVPFAQVETELLRDPTITPQCKALYSLLISYGPDRIFPGQERLAKELGTSRQSVSKWLGQLKKRGIIDWRRRGSTSNEYRLLGYSQCKPEVTLEDDVKQGLQQMSSVVDNRCKAGFTRSISSELDPVINKESATNADISPDELFKTDVADFPPGENEEPSARALDQTTVLGMAAHCAKARQARCGDVPDWAMLGAEGASPFYPVVAVFCTMTGTDPGVLTPRNGKRWLKQYAKIADDHGLSSGEMLEAHRYLPAEDRGAWHIEHNKWGTPYANSYIEALALAGNQIKSGTIVHDKAKEWSQSF